MSTSTLKNLLTFIQDKIKNLGDSELDENVSQLAEYLTDESGASGKKVGKPGETLHEYELRRDSVKKSYADADPVDLTVEIIDGLKDSRLNNYGKVNLKFSCSNGEELGEQFVVWSGSGCRHTSRSACPGLIESLQHRSLTIEAMKKFYAAACSDKSADDRILVAYDRKALVAA